MISTPSSLRFLILFAICSLLGIAFTAFAGTVRGVVTDPEGNAVPNARVSIEALGRVAEAGPAGEFELVSLPPGTYAVSASREDFEPVTAAGVQVVAEGEVEVNFRFLALRPRHYQIDVIGEDPAVALREIPGSGFVIRHEEMEASRPVDGNEVLRRVPGVHIREDSGPVGMRLNVGIRGLNPDRSRQLLVLEDGLPLALAPYGEPEMYYSPPIDRMSRVEILKGSGSIVHGPQTIGGVMNFVTPDPPPQRQGQVEVLGGERGVFIGQASYGGTTKGVGWFVNGLRKQGDGWRDFYYRITDVTPKFNFQIADRHRFALKLGYYDEESNSTYLGLTEGQFRSNPNFNAVPDDRLEVDRMSGSLLHQFVITPRALLSTTAFGYSTRRDWRRQDFDRTPRPGVDYLRVEGDPSVPGGAIYLRNSATNNNRSFDVAGAESRLAWEHETFGWRQKLDAGFRYLWEEHRDRQIAGRAYNSSDGSLRSDEIRNGNALSGFVQDRIFLSSRLSLTPGLRLEHYDYTRNILRRPVGGIPTDVNILGGDTVSKAIPGIGATWQATSDVTVYGGVHRGFAPPRVKDAITPDGAPLELDAELSWNYELGARGQVRRGLSAEATFFRTDFSNQIIPASVSGGATSTLMNAGETLHQGAEFLLATDWDRLLERTTGVTAELRYTWLGIAEFENGIYDGNRLPYAPVHLLSMNVGYRHRRGFTVFLDGTRVGDQYADNRETAPPSNDGTIGLIPSYWVWNVCAGYEWSRERYSLKPFVTIKNFTDSLYISSRAPQGIQPGMFRQVNAGVRFRF